MSYSNKKAPGNVGGAFSVSDEEVGTRMSIVVDLYDLKSDAAKAMGVTPETLANNIREGHRLRIIKAAALCYPKGISLDWLVTGKGPMLLAERTAPVGEASIDPMDEALLGNLVAGVEMFLTRQDLIIEAHTKARLMVLLYRMMAKRRRELQRQGIMPPPELAVAGHPIDIATDPDLSEIVQLAS